MRTLEVRTAVQASEQKIVSWRRHLHAHPELGYEEVETAAFVVRLLKSFGLQVEEGVGGTGVVAWLRGEGAGEGLCVALRADMDALSVTEETGLPFASRNQGKMHACGHDGHTAILLGVAKVLSERRQSFAGTVKFFFQPAEECAPRGGALDMIDAGAMQDPKVDYVFALHLWPELPLGKIGIKAGALMSASDRVRIRIQGKGGHGAAPHQAIDAVVVASHVVAALQTIASRQVDPLEPFVLTIGSFHAGQRYNVIAPYAELDGTVRTQNEALRSTMPNRITCIAQAVAEAWGAEAQINYEYGYPTLYNEPHAVEAVSKAVAEVLGEEALVELTRPSMGGEDFAYFLNHAKGAMFWLGCHGPLSPDVPIHNGKFDFDESSLAVGTCVLVQTTLNTLRLQRT
ncbi:MAG: N-acyl-L-amino acid amidohydrolase [Firmicutes bacterium]|nr:N-acyl-L-amino acid amidohydrolase [candidate division NPL-UPA2 bacterium]